MQILHGLHTRSSFLPGIAFSECTVSPVLWRGGHLFERITNKLLKYALAFSLVQFSVFIRPWRLTPAAAAGRAPR